MTCKRIVFLSQLFDPEYSIKGVEFIKFLVDRGHEVEVVTTFPSYPKGILFHGYKSRFRQIETIDGVKVIRLWSFISPNKSKLHRLLNYVSFFVTATSYLLFCKKFDLLYGYHPQVTTGVTGRLLKRLRNIPYITDVQDLWPESLVAEGMRAESKAVTWIRRIVKPSLVRADAVVVLSEGFKEYLVRQGIEPQRIHVVHNWCPEEKRYFRTQPSKKSVNSNSGAVKFFYTGNHGPLQALDTVIRAFSRFNNEQATLTLVGQGSEKQRLMMLTKQLEAENINFVDFVSPNELVVLLNQADVLVCSLKNDPLFDITIPSKTQAYLCSGKPILIAAGNEASRLVTDAKGGIAAQAESVEAIVEAIHAFTELSPSKLSEMGKNGKDFYFENMAAKHGYSRLLKVIDSVCDN